MGLSVASTRVELSQPLPENRTEEMPVSTLASTEFREEVLTQKTNVRLDYADCEILCALAAMQVRYGKAHEAVVYLMAVRQSYPGHEDATRLLATAFMKLGRWQEARQMADEYQALTSEPGRMFHLFRAMIEFKQSRMDAARSWLAKFINSREITNV